MTKQILAATVLLTGVAFVLTTPAWAGVINETLDITNGASGTSAYYDSPDGFDYGFPATTPTPGYYEVIGTFTGLNIPVGDYVTGITISGSFGDPDGYATALSDYYLGDPTDGETAVEVTGCDVANSLCNNSDSATSWGPVSLTGQQIGELSNGLADGSLDFTFTWDSDPPASAIVDETGTYADGYVPQYVYAGAPTITLDYAPTPEPVTVLICFSGLAGIAALRRFRKV